MGVLWVTNIPVSGQGVRIYFGGFVIYVKFFGVKIGRFMTSTLSFEISDLQLVSGFTGYFRIVVL